MPPQKTSDDAAGQRVTRHRVKRLLRLLPRRAVFHRYPIIGRFAPFARRRAYLWSFKPEHMRPAIYVGAIISLWPLMGFQVALAFVAALLVRGNVMVAAALQLITNPLPPHQSTISRIASVNAYWVGTGTCRPNHPATRRKN